MQIEGNSLWMASIGNLQGFKLLLASATVTSQEVELRTFLYNEPPFAEYSIFISPKNQSRSACARQISTILLEGCFIFQGEKLRLRFSGSIFQHSVRKTFMHWHMLLAFHCSCKEQRKWLSQRKRLSQGSKSDFCRNHGKFLYFRKRKTRKC